MAAAAAAVDRDAANAVATPEAGLTVLIVGGGNAAHVLAAMCGDDSRERIVGRLLSTVGDEAERIKAGIDENGGIVANVHHDGSTIKGKLEIVSNDVEKCTTGADVIIFALPAFAHQPLLEKMAPFVKDGATIGAFPARGAFDSCVIDCLGLEKASRVTIFGLETLPWACRIKEYGKTVDILGTKRDVDVAVSPTGGADHACKRLQRIIGPLPTLTPVGNFLALTLMNVTWHPTILYGAFKDWDGKTEFDEAPLFYEGVSEEAADKISAISDETIAARDRVTAAYEGVDLTAADHITAWIRRAYETDIGDPSTLQTCMNTNLGYKGLTAPMKPAESGSGRLVPNFDARYVSEDTPMGLAVVRGIAELAGVPTPHMDDVMLWAQGVLGKEYLVDDGAGGYTLAGKDLADTRSPQRYGYKTLDEYMKAHRYVE